MNEASVSVVEIYYEYAFMGFDLLLVLLQNNPVVPK